MFDRLSNGWEVAGQSWRVLKQDKELVVFPLLSSLAALVLMTAFALPVFAIPGLREATFHLVDGAPGSANEAVRRVLAGLFAFAFYFLSYFVIVYFNTALAACAVYRFRGGDPTVALGFRMANERLPQIMGWAALAATVGMVLNLIESKSEWLGKLVVSILGGLWTIATYLVVPTLAVEGLGPVDALKRSTKLIGEVWGEGLAGNFSLGLVSFLLVLPAILAIVLVGVLTPHWVVVALVVIAAVLYMMGVAVVTSAVKHVFIAGLYVYATERRVPEGFDADLMRGAFARK
jgi:hypothetical protein